MSVESLFSSATKIQILRTLSGTKRAFSAQELEEETTKNRAAVYKALDLLKKESVLKEIRTDGKTSYYRLNREREFVNDVEALFYSEEKNYEVKNVPKKVLNILFDLKQKLTNQVEGLQKVILFGSTSRGDYTPGSDIDLYIVVEDLDKEMEDTIYELVGAYDHEFSLILRSEEDYKGEFEKPLTDLADSMIKDGFTVLYRSEDKTIQKIVDSGDRLEFDENIEVEEK